MWLDRLERRADLLAQAAGCFQRACCRDQAA